MALRVRGPAFAALHQANVEGVGYRPSDDDQPALVTHDHVGMDQELLARRIMQRLSVLLNRGRWPFRIHQGNILFGNKPDVGNPESSTYLQGNFSSKALFETIPAGRALLPTTCLIDHALLWSVLLPKSISRQHPGRLRRGWRSHAKVPWPFCPGMRRQCERKAARSAPNEARPVRACLSTPGRLAAPTLSTGSATCFMTGVTAA